MSGTAVKIGLFLVTWSGALLGSLSLRNFSGGWTHSICGPWGCGPPLETLLACHLAWFVLLIPPTVVVLRTDRVSRTIRRGMGLFLTVLGATGLAVVVAAQRFVWWPAVTDLQREYFWNRCGFSLICAVDFPLVQLLSVGIAMTFWRRAPRSQPVSPGGRFTKPLRPE